MKLLLDENLPKKLKIHFTDHEIFTVSDMRWMSKKNGELLQLMIEHQFDVLFTFDKNLQFQQNFQKYPLTVLILQALDNTYPTLMQLVPEIKCILNKPLYPGPIIVQE